MPILIHEIHVRAFITDDALKNANSTGGNTAKNNGAGSAEKNDKNAMVEDCVRQVLAILERKNSR